MGKTMLFCVSLAVLLSLMATEASTVLPTTAQPTQGTPEGMTDTSNQPTAKATEIGTPMVTTPPTSIPQTQTIANLNATSVYATRDVQTSPIYSSEMSTTYPNSTSKSNDLATSTVENAETSTTNIETTQSAIPGMILSTSSGFTSSVQTGTMETETPKVEVPTDGATRSVPTAKLSATTQFVTSVQSATNASKTTKPVMTTSFISTTQLVPPAEKTTVKLAQTTRKIIPPATSSKNLKTTEEDETKKGIKHGKIVAGLIGGALLAMMIGFLVILYKKHKLKKHQVATSDWAGPTPFLEAGGSGGGDNGHVTLRAASRISLTSFLPQRLSKRLSLLAESGEEMQDMQEMTTGTTFTANAEKKSDRDIEKSAKETNGNKLGSSEKTEEVVLLDEMTANEREARKDKQNGQAITQDGLNGELKNVPAPKEEAPIELNDENKEQIEKDGADNDV